MEKTEPIILSLGGSLIVPNGGIDTDFLKKFNEFIRQEVAAGRRFFIVCGGGRTARHYRDAGQAVMGKKLTDDDLDWLGIHATRINAHLLRTIFKDLALPRVIDKYDIKYDTSSYPIIICSGWKPGWSTDYDAVALAKNYHAKTLINLSNIDMVYDKDPSKFKDATPIERTSWEYFRSLIGDKWDPGLNTPFDPVASQLAQKLDLTVVILRGNNLENLEKVFKGKKFTGTVIAPFQIDASFYNQAYFEGGKSGERKGYTTDPLIKFRRILRDIYRAMKIKLLLNPKTLLDVGCGTGQMVYFLRLLGVEAQGLEISQYLLSKANPQVKKYLRMGNIMSLPYKDSSFEVVTTADVLEHVPTEDLKVAVLECNRVAQKFVLHKIFTTENQWIKHFHGPDISHVSVFGKNWWSKFWKELNLKPAEKFYPSLPVFMETLFLLEKKK